MENHGWRTAVAQAEDLSEPCVATGYVDGVMFMFLVHTVVTFAALS